MKRKSPKIHRVRAHTRKGRKVRSYIRGVKKANIHLSKPKLTKEPKGYTVQLKYKNGKTEEIKVIATSYQRAIDEAFEEKTNPGTPIEITVIDPSLGEIIHWAGERALKYGKIAASKALEKTKQGVYDYRVKTLIRQAYSDNPVERTFARAKLRKDYAYVWDVMDISKT